MHYLLKYNSSYRWFAVNSVKILLLIRDHKKKKNKHLLNKIIVYSYPVHEIVEIISTSARYT